MIGYFLSHRLVSLWPSENGLRLRFEYEFSLILSRYFAVERAYSVGVNCDHRLSSKTKPTHVHFPIYHVYAHSSKHQIAQIEFENYIASGKTELTLVYLRGPLRFIFRPAKTLNSTIKWVRAANCGIILSGHSSAKKFTTLPRGRGKVSCQS